MAEQKKKIVVIGGGITGLSAAYYTQKFFQEKGIGLDLTLVEKSATLGGKIQTSRRDGFVIERGPDSFLARKLPIIELTQELGLEGELTTINPNGKQSYILLKGQLHPMPAGMVLGIPTQLTPFMKTGLVSPLGKARAAMDLVLPRRKEEGDESLGDFIERRLGKEVLDHIAEPLLAGIYAGDTHYLSLRATFPQFHSIEKKRRSLILGMGESRKATTTDPNLPEIVKKNTFLTYKKGLTTLVERLIEVLEGTQLLTNLGVNRITKQGEGYQLSLDNGTQIKADGVILAVPTHAAAAMLTDVPTAQKLSQIPYVSVANIIFAFDKKDITFSFNGSGFVIPRSEGRNITACTWTSTKWLHTAPDDKALLRCYIGRAGEEALAHLPEDALLEKVKHELRELMGITAEPLFYEINRWHDSMPQYPVGHLELIQQVRTSLSKEMPGILVTGAGYQGVGIPDCIRQGKEAASQITSLWS